MPHVSFMSIIYPPHLISLYLYIIVILHVFHKSTYLRPVDNNDFFFKSTNKSDGLIENLDV